MPAPPIPVSPRPGRRLRRGGWSLGLLGLLAAAIVFFHAARADAAATDDGSGYRIVAGQAYRSDDSAGANSQSERLGGKALVRTAAFDRWVRSLLQGERLAATLVVVSVAAWGICLYLAGLADEDVVQEVIAERGIAQEGIAGSGRVQKRLAGNSTARETGEAPE